MSAWATCAHCGEALRRKSTGEWLHWATDIKACAENVTDRPSDARGVE